jgi:conjugative relaxase-like TrwC/TraI family protein
VIDVLTISKPLSAAQARAYHANEFGNARENYYTTADQVRGQWHGQLARQWGLHGEVLDDQFARLAEGQHPLTSESLVRHRTPCRYTNEHGQSVTTMAHRAGWDATFSAPKSVSLTALVGGDALVREAHEASVGVALDELERYVQARLGNHPPEGTGRWVAARFEHDSARPVDGYAAPQLHTHVLVFNVTQTETGETRPLQPRELYKTQQYATAVYRAELATRLQGLGYAIGRGEHGQPEIQGYSAAYLEASSPRRQQIEAYLEQQDRHGAGPAQIAAHQTREAKQHQSPEEIHRQHREMAEAFGNQPAHVVHLAKERARDLTHDLAPDGARITPAAAVTFAKDRQLERTAVADERALLRDALTRGMGALSFAAVKSEFEHRVDAGEFVELSQRPDVPGRAFTTCEMIALEQETIQVMRAGQHCAPALASITTRDVIALDYAHLSEPQRAAIDQILASRDQIQALEGVAGAGKTTALAAVRDAAERNGYRVAGFAPTSRAAQQLEEAGIASRTLQQHLARTEAVHGDGRYLYVLDESSLASTRQLHAFLHGLGPDDRALLVGDVRQHQGVDAGRPYQQLQEAGMETTRLDAIVRQKDPVLRAVVEQLARGDVSGAVHQLDAQGRVHEIADRDERLAAIAREYLQQPDRTLIVAPDNRSRMEINQVIHQARQTEGQVAAKERQVRVLVARQEVTGADRQWAPNYYVGDVVRYTKGSHTYGLAAGDYARVVQVNAEDNQVTVRRAHGARVTYDPRRLQGVTLYQEADRAFATGDRVQLTAPDREHRLANRELGTIESMSAKSELRLRLDSGRTVDLNVREHPHLDYGYAVTSHSSQGQTTDRVLVHIDMERAGEHLVNRRLAYVAISRGRYDAQIYTSDKAQLADALDRDVSHRAAIEPTRAPAGPAQKIERSPAHRHSIGFGI